MYYTRLAREGTVGRAETMGVDYFGETVESLQGEFLRLTQPRSPG